MKSLPQGLKATELARLVSGLDKAAEKLWSLKGTGFSPYVSD
jgi:hypothetical protein